MPTIVTALILAGFAIGIGFTVRALMKGAQAKEWPTVSGHVISSEVDYSVSRDRDGSRTRTYKAIVFYEYEVQGNKYTSDKLRSVEFYSSNRRAAYRTAHAYPVGKEVNVYYNPADPADSLLEPGINSGGVMVLVLLLAFMGVAAYLFMTAQRTEQVDTSMLESSSVANVLRHADSPRGVARS